MTDDQIDMLWMCRKDIHDGELMPQLRDLVRAALAAQPQAEPSSATVPSDEQKAFNDWYMNAPEGQLSLHGAWKARAVLALAAPAVPCPRGHLWNDFGSLGGRNVSWCPRCDTIAFTGQEPAAQSADAVYAMHRAIMNIPCEPLTGLAFRLGHRAARHAAAEIVLSQSAAAAKAEPAEDKE